MNPDNTTQLPEPATNQGDPGDSDSYQSLIEKWSPTISAIHSATRNAYASSPQGESFTRADFQRYWHGVFTQLLETIAADPSIPAHLTSPPTDTFIVKFFNRPHGMCCPCSLPLVPPSIKLESAQGAQGVSKMDLVRGVRDYLFGEGEALPVVNVLVSEDRCCEESEECEVEDAVVYTSDWMSNGTDENGERVSYYARTPQVYMYCCPVDEFGEKACWPEEEEEGVKKQVVKSRAT